MRLLHCGICKTLDEIPDYSGSEKVDPLIERVVMEHNRRDPMAHGGQATLPMRLATVKDEDYKTKKEEVLKQFMEEGKKSGLTPWVGESLNTFEEDAMKCWKQHRYPKEGSPCIDYMSDAKRIGRPTEEGQAAVKDLQKVKDKDPHLCHFCPYNVVVLTERRHRKGLYKK